MKGYKGFHKGLVCNGKRYAENTVFEDTGASECCHAGVMHFCETPFDVLDYYPLVDDNGEFSEFAEVEALDEVLVKDNKRATKKLRIGAKLSIRDFIRAAVSVVIESAKQQGDASLSDNGGDWAKIGSSDDWAKIGSSGDGAQIGSSGDWAKIGSSGDWAKIGSSGDWAQIGSSGDGAKIGSSGDRAQIGSSGNWAQIGSSGDWAQIGSSGDWAKIGSSGNWAQIGSSGDWAKINMDGTDSVGAAIGYDSKARGKVGNWIVLAEWKRRDGGVLYPACVKTGLIDGNALKPDTWYTLKDGEFVEVGKDD